MKDKIEIETLHLFSVIDKLLIDLLKSLTEEEWDKPTVARLWTVKDIAAHLLDGNVRGISIYRDQYMGIKAENIHSYQELVAFLNKINMSWTDAAKRMSPQLLIELLEITGKQYVQQFETLDPFADAIFSVAWAGQETSPNWFHIAREYTEKFLHQQQIRDAVKKQGILTKELYQPFLDIFMYALPHTYRAIDVPEGTTVSVIISSEVGGQWNIIKQVDGWKLSKGDIQKADSKVTIDPDTAWKLFSKSWSPADVINKIEISGDRALGEQALHMVSVMA